MKQCVFIATSLNGSSVSDYFQALANKFDDEGYKVVIFTKKRDTIDGFNKNVEVCFYVSNRPTGFSDFKLVYDKIKIDKPILTISSFGAVNVFILASYLAKVPNRVAWIRTLSTQFGRQSKFLVFRRTLVYRLASIITVNSNATKEDVSSFFKINKKKITVLPNSVNNYHDHGEGAIYENNKIVFVGRLDPSKGIDTLIRAVKLLVDEGIEVTLDIIGSGKQKDELQELVEKLKLNDVVIFEGNKPKAHVLKALKNAHCTVVPSRSEAFGYVVIEGMSVGTCVIGANNTGIKETIIDNETGLLFETGNHTNLAEKLKMVLLDSDFRNQLAINGHQRFLDFYETSKAIQRDFDFFKKIANDD